MVNYRDTARLMKFASAVVFLHLYLMHHVISNLQALYRSHTYLANSSASIICCRLKNEDKQWETTNSKQWEGWCDSNQKHVSVAGDTYKQVQSEEEARLQESEATQWSQMGSQKCMGGERKESGRKVKCIMGDLAERRQCQRLDLRICWN